MPDDDSPLNPAPAPPSDTSEDPRTDADALVELPIGEDCPVEDAAEVALDVDAVADPYATGPVDPRRELFHPTLTFDDLGLSPAVLTGLQASGFERPTGIQAELIPLIIAGKDVIGQAKTGTGKTAAFGLPILSMADPEVHTQGLVLAPTRELAHQIARELDDLGRATGIRTTTVIGGESQRDQTDSLAEGGHLVVGTPGRVDDLIGQRQLKLDDLRFVVLDEVDRMLDIGFRDAIRKILREIREAAPGAGVQTIFVSATVDAAIERLARSFMKDDAEKIVTVSGSLTVAAVDQKYISVERWDKRALLLKMLQIHEPEAAVVFCRTKAGCKKLSAYLKDQGLSARELHGDLHQSRRNKVMAQLRDEKIGVLIATDVAARGLDVDHITHVVNFDLPEDPENYIHRIGRTARAGRGGTAWSFVAPDQGQHLTAIEQLAGAQIERMEVPEFEPGPVPEDVREGRSSAGGKPDAPAKPSDRIQGVDTRGHSEDELKAMFPDGKIPRNKPRRTLSAKFKRRTR